MHFQLQWHEVVGMIGVLFCLLAYMWLQTGKLRGDRLPFQVMNLLGAGAIALSLLYNFNLSAMTIELAWIGISIYGIVRSEKVRRRHKQP
jgi:hypothetical protein